MKLIITGATGMVGEGVLHEALQHPDVEDVLVIGRRSCKMRHAKLKELIHKDFFNISSITEGLEQYDACLFCLGVSSIGMKEEEYHKMSHTLTLHIAQTLSSINPNMTFCYISGAGTDSTEKGRIMWARVKGKTENDLLKLPFRAVYNFRPAVLQPTKGMKNTLKSYKYFGWLMPAVKLLAPKYICSLKELGQAMINAADFGFDKHILEVTDIVSLSARKKQTVSAA